MQNTQLKDNGLSRGFKLPAGYITQYQSWTAFLADACSAAGISCDITGLRAEGVSVFGTDYSKATCLPDSVEQAIWGSAANRNIGQALQQLRSLITAAQNTIPKIITGVYYGTGAASKTLSLSSRPKLVIVAPYAKIAGNTDDSRYTGRIAPAIVFLYGCANAIGYELLQTYGYLTMSSPLAVTWSGNSVTWSSPDNGGTGHTAAYNRAESTYYWIAIC